MNHLLTLFCAFFSIISFKAVGGPMDNDLIASFLKKVNYYLQSQEIKVEDMNEATTRIKIKSLASDIEEKSDKNLQLLIMALFRHDKLAVFLFDAKLKIITEIENGNFEFLYQMRDLFQEEELTIVYSFSNIFRQKELLATTITFVTKMLLYYLYEMIEEVSDQSLTDESLSPQSSRTCATTASESQESEDLEPDEELFKSHKISLPPVRRTLHNSLVANGIIRDQSTKSRLRRKSLPITKREIRQTFT